MRSAAASAAALSRSSYDAVALCGPFTRPPIRSCPTYEQLDHRAARRSSPADRSDRRRPARRTATDTPPQPWAVALLEPGMRAAGTSLAVLAALIVLAPAA